MSKYGVISGPYFPIFGLNTDIYSVNLCIQSEHRKIWTRNNPVFGHFSRSALVFRLFRQELQNIHEATYFDKHCYFHSWKKTLAYTVEIMELPLLRQF